ncbi:chemotaxis protein CheW [Solimicrobium silvestre]|uniref:Chemotaxis signal transduction protein n=1 Tax=Solimicrobium silvestre TaxID=2099400 RepID=A0A2S9H5D9_9BURK|nr:chemotaxis protein CheW [Solimicrobium silvestre]PRC95178.1 Chemotaxis signal transduction protein [Solimicrobium silvestre]
MTSSIALFSPFLICRSGVQSCGFPLEHVAETMRALPVEVFPDMLPFMFGVSIIRGVAVPVVNLAGLLGGATDTGVTRYVTVRLGNRLVAFAVGSVVGVSQLAADVIDGLPPLLGEADRSIVAAIGTLDSNLFLVLEASRVIPESVWQVLDARGMST